MCSASDHVFQESEDSNLGSKGQDTSKQNGKSKTMNTQPESSPSTGPTSSDTPTSEMLFDLQSSISSAEASPAKMFHLPAPERALGGGDPLFGLKCFDSFARLGPTGSWLKMYQGYFQMMVDSSLETFLETWPTHGTMRNGVCYPRPEWEPRIFDDVSSYWPTPRAADADKGIRTVEGHRKERERRGNGVDLPTALGGRPNPMWVEWLLGYPLGFTEVKILTKAASRKRAQRAFPKILPCEICGGSIRVQRHHHDHQSALSVRFLCQSCHTKEEVLAGTWGIGPKKKKVCKNCGKEFERYTHSRVQLCGKQCLSQIGRLNALKRWGTKKTALDASETPSSHRLRKRSAK